MPSRRQFVGSVGAGLLLAPFINLALRRRAHASNQSKRLLIFSTMGTYPPLWTPTVSGESITAWSAMTQPLSAVAGNVVLVEGMPSANPNDGHGTPDGITGQSTGYYTDSTGKQIVCSSVDQYIANMTSLGFGRPIASLLLGANTNANNGKTQYYGGPTGGNLPTIGSPLSAYNTVFGTALPTGTSASALLARRQSILDTITAEITGLQSQLGSSEKAKLELHLESIQALENKLTSTATNGGCMKPATPPADSALQFMMGMDTLAANLLHQQIILAAFACDITRIACLEYGNDQYLLVNQSGLPADDEHGGYIHSESTTNFPNLVKFEAYLATQFANLITALATTPDPLGNNQMLLDNTLVLWSRDMGDAQNHNQQSMRFVLAGGNGGYLKTASGGRYIKSTERHERILLNACEALGVTSYSGFGDPNCPNKSPLPDIAA
jgi:Protein of unknown function (DUF1552)